MPTSAEYKEQGNAAFAAKDYQKSIELFTSAIDASTDSSTLHVLYSNRSGSYTASKQFENALKDATKVIELKPDWPKGYTRLAAAQYGLGQFEGAVESYSKALEIDPNNAQAKQGLEQTKQQIERSKSSERSGFESIFSDPKNMEKLMQNPKTREYFKDPEFVKNVEQLIKNPMGFLQQKPDNRMLEVLGVLMGGADPTEQGGSTDGAESTPKETPKEAPKEAPKPAPKATPKEEPKSSADPTVSEADAEKQKGNALYKQRQFDAAIEHYDKAFSLHKDITYLNNRSAAEYEKGDYEAAIQTGLRAVEESLELHSDYKAVAKALGRIGSSYLKLDKLKEAIEYFEKSLTEQRTPDVLNKLRSTQKLLRKREEEAYIDTAKADEARELGNQQFKEGKFPESVNSYTEAIKRNPSDPRGYGNRAASFLKLMNYPDVVIDCDKAIELDPNFIKAYTRKATALNIMKHYREAMDTLEKAREVDTQFKHTREIEELYQRASTARFARLSGETDVQRAERLSKDPEVEEVINDPIMRTILQQASGNPAALQDHMKNPEIRKKINLLISAGIIGTR